MHWRRLYCKVINVRSNSLNFTCKKNIIDNGCRSHPINTLVTCLVTFIRGVLFISRRSIATSGPKEVCSNAWQRVKILQLAETWTRYISLSHKNGIACRADDKLTFLVPGGNAPGLISRFGIEWTVSLSSLRTITILTPHWQFTLFISFHRHGSSCSISLEKVAARPRWRPMHRYVCNIQHILLPFSFAKRNGSPILDSLDNAMKIGYEIARKKSRTSHWMFYRATFKITYF